MDRGDPLSLFLLPTWKRPDLDRGEGEWEWQWAGKFMKHSQKDVSVRCSVDPSGDGRPGVDCRWQQSGNSARKGGSLLSLSYYGIQRIFRRFEVTTNKELNRFIVLSISLVGGEFRFFGVWGEKGYTLFDENWFGCFCFIFNFTAFEKGSNVFVGPLVFLLMNLAWS